MSFSHAIPFSYRQLQTLSAWDREGASGFELRISNAREEMDEVVELFRIGAAAPSYALAAVSTGEVEIFGVEGEIGTVPDLPTAIAWIAQWEGATVG